MTHARAYGLLALVVMIWAGNYPLGKAGLSEFGPITLTFARAVIAVPFLVLVARWTEDFPSGLTRRDYRTFVVMSLTGLSFDKLLSYDGDFTDETAFSFAWRMMEAVSQLHKAKFIHR